ncbi:MAG: DUF1846 family protein, partial [Ruminococcaceae bacterium]|nr:DUF1846 family protein [Oscillospiraceae bacterium]
KQEIIRRFYNASCSVRQGSGEQDEVFKIEMIMNRLGITTNDRPETIAALSRERETGGPAMAITLPDGKLITGKTSPLLGACAALILNALKHLAGIDDDVLLISPDAIEPIQELKVNHMGSKNPRLHSDETLIALAISASTNETASLAMSQLTKLKGCEAHSSVILSRVDERVFQKLGINVTYEPKYQTQKLYHN